MARTLAAVRIVWTREAVADLDEKFAFLAVHDPQAARNAIDTIRSAVRNLSASAGRWPVVDDTPYRKCKVGKFVILYKPLASERLEVSRIHHTRQNWR